VSEAADALRAADRRLATARLLLDEEHHADAVSRAYYAMFHAAKALLAIEGSHPKTHSGVASELGALYRDRIDRALLSEYTAIQDLREDADDGVENGIDAERAREAVETATAFHSVATSIVADSS